MAKYEGRNAWASQTIRMRNLQPGQLRRSDSSLHAYPALKYCQVRLKNLGDSGGGNPDQLRISRTIPRSQAPQHDYSLEETILEKILEMENQDKALAEKRVKLQEVQKLCEEQQRILKGVTDMQEERNRRRENQELKKMEGQSDEKSAKIANFSNITGEQDIGKIRDIFEKNEWDLQRAMSFHFSNIENKPPPPAGSVHITIYVDNKKNEWTYKSSETLWDLYTMVARMGKRESFHFVDSNGKKYKEHMFDTTFAEAGWVPSVTLTVCKDNPKPKLLDI